MKKISDLDLNFSIIIAVYQRKNELVELLQSLTYQTDKDFEVIVVDDGSPEKLEGIILEFSNQLDIHYYYKSNSGAGKSRNIGMEKAAGNYFIFLDSDTIVPKNYIYTVRENLKTNFTDAYGGPDAAAEDFSDLQKAISFSMTSYLTTGGIRGGKKHIGKFQPRSFNMGISRTAFEQTGGFGELRIGEDPDLSMTLWEKGFETQLIPEAKVYHKRRTSLKKFAKQVYQFGVARPILNQRHPNYTKLTFWFPTLFSIGLILSILGYIFSFFIDGFWRIILIFPLLVYVVYFQILFLSASIQFQSLKVGFYAVITSFIQFFNYGFGFLKSWIFIHIFKFKAETVFPSHFSN